MTIEEYEALPERERRALVVTAQEICALEAQRTIRWIASQSRSPLAETVTIEELMQAAAAMGDGSVEGLTDALVLLCRQKEE